MLARRIERSQGLQGFLKFVSKAEWRRMQLRVSRE